jgi:hypothetical protein
MAGIWTYSRDGEKLQIHHIEHEGKAELIVQGLGPTSRREFTSLEAILLYVTMLEGNLVAAGWSLSHFHPERRSGQERRTTRMDAPDRRRPSPVPPKQAQAD